jgi:hypothetical protein
VIDDGTSTNYRFAVGAAGFLDGDVAIGTRVAGEMSTFGAPIAPPGFVVARVGAGNNNVPFLAKGSGTAPIPIRDIVTDEASVYIAGAVPVGANATLGTTVINGGHGFVARMRSNNGGIDWAHEIGATTSSVTGLQIKAGRPIVVSGTFRGTLGYPLAPNGTLSKPGQDPRSTAYVMLIERTTGRALWGRTFLSATTANPQIDADINPSGDVEVALTIAGAVTTDGATFATYDVGRTQLVMTRLAGASGAPSAPVAHQTDSQDAVAIRALPSGDVVVGGDTVGLSSIGTDGTPVARPSTDVFVMKTNPAHQPIWSKFLTGKTPAVAGSERPDYFSCLDVDPWGRIVFAGQMASNGARLDGADVPGARTADATTNYIVLAKLAEDGITLWAKGFNAGTTAEIRPVSCRFGRTGDVLLSAAVFQNASPNFGGGALPPATNERAVVVRLTP